jgi:hypothetical protein
MTTARQAGSSFAVIVMFEIAASARDIWDLAGDLERDGGDRPTDVLLVHGHGRGRAQLGWLVASIRELRAERHRETPGVRCGDQLLGVCPRTAILGLEARVCTIRLIFERSAQGRDLAVALGNIAVPNHTAASLECHDFLLGRCLETIVIPLVGC